MITPPPLSPIVVSLGEKDYAQDVTGFDLTTLSDTVSVVNGISDGTTSKDNVLKMYAEGSTQVHSIRNNDDAASLSGRLVRVEFDYYIPSAQTNVDSGVVRVGESSLTSFTTVGSWTSESIDISDVTSNGVEGVQFRLRASAATSPLNFLGAGDPNDDILYLTNIVVYEIGGAAKCLVSANDFADISASVSGAPRVFANRTNNSNTSVDVTIDHIGTPAYENVRLYVSDDHRGQFAVLENKTTLPYTHAAAIGTAVNNYKYRATYVSTGTKGGVAFDEESAPSRPVYTTGTRTI